MASTFHTNYFKEKRILEEEEKCLTQMMDKFKDQLNRLKIEELALISLMKMQSSTGSDISRPPTRTSDCSKSVASDAISNISAMVPVGIIERPSAALNQEVVDLRVDTELLNQVNRTINEFEEEMDDEDEENDSDDGELDDFSFL